MKSDKRSRNPPARHHEDTRLTSVLIIAGSVIVMLLACLTASHIVLRNYARNRPMQPMESLGILNAPDNRPLTRLPAPNLELDDGHAEYMELRQRQLEKLNTYGWIDQSNRIARIPIERAMDLIAAQGLPARTNPQTNGSLQLEATPERTTR